MVNRITQGTALVGGLTAEDDVTVGDDISVTDDATVGGDLTVTGALTAGGTINLGDPVAFIADPTGGTATAATDAEARAAIVLILDALDATGIMAPS